MLCVRRVCRIDMTPAKTFAWWICTRCQRWTGRTTTEELGMTGSEVTYRDIRLRGLEQDVTYLGCITRSGSVELMPPNDTVIPPDSYLVFIE